MLLLAFGADVVAKLFAVVQLWSHVYGELLACKHPEKRAAAPSVTVVQLMFLVLLYRAYCFLRDRSANCESFDFYFYVLALPLPAALLIVTTLVQRTDIKLQREWPIVSLLTLLVFPAERLFFFIPHINEEHHPFLVPCLGLLLLGLGVRWTIYNPFPARWNGHPPLPK